MTNPPSIRLQRPNFTSIFWTTVFICAFIASFEFLTSFSWFRSWLLFPSPDLKSSFPELDVKFQRLDNLGRVNCMFFGSSMVDADFDPQVFERVLNDGNGSELNCFNMGFSGSMVETSGLVATTLSRWQTLDLVIFGVSPIEMDRNFQDTRPIANMPVFSHFNSRPSLAGFLFNHFRFPWYYAGLTHVYDASYLEEQKSWDELLDAKGVRRTGEIGQIDKESNAVYLPDFQPNPVDMAVFRSTMQSLRDQGTKVIVVEMPVHDAFFPYLIGGGETTYHDRFLEPVMDILDEYNIELIRTQPIISSLVNDDHWTNRNHLNFAGAEILSQFIAEQVLLEKREN